MGAHLPSVTPSLLCPQPPAAGYIHLLPTGLCCPPAATIFYSLPPGGCYVLRVAAAVFCAAAFCFCRYYAKEAKPINLVERKQVGL